MLALVTAAGCGGSSSGGSKGGGTTPPGPGAMRGVRLASFSCGATAGNEEVRVAPQEVRRIRVCALPAPAPFNRPAHAVTLAAGDQKFAALVQALALPDASPTPGQMCPEYAELRPPILAATGSVAFRVAVPVDGCDHTLPAVGAALVAVLGR